MPAPKDPIKYAEYCRKISEGHKNRSTESYQKPTLKGKPRTEEDRKKISEGQLGKKRPGYIDTLSQETRLKLSLATKGKKRSEENCRKISEARMGKHLSEETTRRVSEAKKGTPSCRKGATLSDETKAKLRESRIGTTASLETRLKMGEARKGEKNAQWKGGISFEPYCQKFDEPFKERVRAFFNRRCVECGGPENGKRLDVHHVNFDKQSCCNGAAPLFVALCVSCHAKTNHNREYYEKHFTELIESEYDGKCYLTKEEMLLIN